MLDKKETMQDEAVTQSQQEISMIEQAENEVPEIDKIEQAVRAWFTEHIHNSPASQDTTVYNHIVSGIDKLITKIKEVV